MDRSRGSLIFDRLKSQTSGRNRECSRLHSSPPPLLGSAPTLPRTRRHRAASLSFPTSSGHRNLPSLCTVAGSVKDNDPH